MKKIRKETALFTGITAGLAFLIGLFLGLSNNWDLFLPTLFFADLIILSIGLILFKNRTVRI